MECSTNIAICYRGQKRDELQKVVKRLQSTRDTPAVRFSIMSSMCLDRYSQDAT